VRDTVNSKPGASNKGPFVAQVSNAERASESRFHTSEGYMPSHDDAALVTAQISKLPGIGKSKLRQRLAVSKARALQESTM
jgi:hypothetical protein